MKGEKSMDQSSAKITIPEHELRKHLSNFGLRLIKSFMKDRHEEIRNLTQTAMEIKLTKPTIH